MRRTGRRARGRSSRARICRGLAAGAIVVAVLGSPTPSPAQVDGTGFFYRASGQATPILLQFQRDTYILDPILNLNPLDTRVDITSTGDRQATASLFNPGPLGDFPALIGLAVSGLPEIPYPGYPLTVRASHPVRPEDTLGVGDIPGGTDSGANVRPATVHVEADESSATAEGTGTRFGVAADLVTVGGVESRSRAVDDGSSVKLTTLSSFVDVDIAGLVHIDDLETRIDLTVDGEWVRATAGTTLSRVTALGAEFAVDENGFTAVTILGVPAPPAVALDQATDALDDALSALGMSVRLLPGTAVEAPADGSEPFGISAGGLEIELPVTVSEDVAIPSVPGFPLGIPIGGGIPTTATVRLASAQAGASAGGIGDIFGAGDLATASTGGPTTPGGGDGSVGVGTGGSDGPMPDAPVPSSSSGEAAESAVDETAAPPAPSPSTRPSAAATGFDFTPAFRWMLFATLAVLASGWPMTRRRLAGHAISSRDLLRSLSPPSGDHRR